MYDDEVKIVGIGASAGGLQSLQKFFSQVRADSSLCYVVITHLPIDHYTHLDRVLSRFTSLPITLLTHDHVPLPNHVFVLPGRFRVFLREGRFIVEERSPEKMNRVIDDFFLSLAKEKGEHAVGVILSGTGSDGTIGMNEIHSMGGTGFVEDPTSAAYDGMPRNAISGDHPDQIVLAEELGAIVSQKFEGIKK